MESTSKAEVRFREVGDRAKTQSPCSKTRTGIIHNCPALSPSNLWYQLLPRVVNLQMRFLAPNNPVRGEAGVHLSFIWLQPHADATRLHCLDIKRVNQFHCFNDSVGNWEYSNSLSCHSLRFLCFLLSGHYPGTTVVLSLSFLESIQFPILKHPENFSSVSDGEGRRQWRSQREVFLKCLGSNFPFVIVLITNSTKE